MGKRDYRQRETKKHKKDAKKLPPITILPIATGVEVIKKGKQKRGAEEEEEG
ncbi:hypothetical protein ACFLUO_05695 [Chloroflexota bacterium]